MHTGTPRIELTLTSHFILSTDPTEQYPLDAFAEFLTDRSVGSTLLEALVETYCGDKHVYINGNKRFQRPATITRSAVTTAGKHQFTLNYVEDRATTNDESSHFCTIEDLIDSDRK